MKIKYLLIMLFVFLGACSEKSNEAESQRINPNEVKASDEMLQQIKIQQATKIPIKRSLDIPGSIEVKQNLLARIGSPVKGRIIEISGMLGQTVKQGDILALINSIELAQQQLNYIKSVQMVELKTKAYERAVLLFDADVVSEAQKLERKTELSAAKAEMEASKDQLFVMGMTLKEIEDIQSETQIDAITSIVAKIDGKIIKKNVNVGQVVEPTEDIFTIAKLSEVWGVAQVPERQIGFLKEGDDILIDVPAYEEKHVEGKISYLGDIVDPVTRTVIIRTEIDNSHGLLKPDMLITMKVSGKEVEKVGVPVNAIVSIDDIPNVFIKIADNKFLLRPVTLGIKNKEFIHIEDGLMEGEEVVIDGAFHLNNERLYTKE
ncbi:MAG: efflux RND transporter periplasmic adaptor subunit [Proteobacteria bacterium]|nr:efflux RND transporter periplasmic adaptor subunit [Pseudomonadota bacterium]MDA0941340.1 efflux RND transporter periplasmic adaptor subunit [Pseudomonadota bacterium]